jgi:hypothetical protein
LVSDDLGRSLVSRIPAMAKENVGAVESMWRHVLKTFDKIYEAFV